MLDRMHFFCCYSSCLLYFLLLLFCLYFEVSFFQIGSTEWVEENLADLHSKAVAYLNVDCAVQGVGFFAGSTPQLDKLLVDVTKQVEFFLLHSCMFLFCYQKLHSLFTQLAQV